MKQSLDSVFAEAIDTVLPIPPLTDFMGPIIFFPLKDGILLLPRKKSKENQLKFSSHLL